MEFKSFDYDLKNEIPLFRDCGQDSLYKFLLYKDKAPSLSFDCDRCTYMKNVYAQLWGFNDRISDNFQQISIGDKSILMGMDTMNSLWNILKWTLNSYCKNDLKEELGISSITLKSIEVLLENYSILKSIMINRLSQKTFDKFLLFAQLTHTIGNMVLVPKKLAPYTPDNFTFNQKRNSEWNDYFDLSLLWLYNNNEPEWDKETLNQYFNMFFLSGYASVDFGIIPLMSSHKRILKNDFKLDKNPDSRVELDELLDNINNRIICRGKIMYEKLMEGDITDSLKDLNKNVNVKDAVFINKSKYNMAENVEAKKVFVKNLLFHFLLVFLYVPSIIIFMPLIYIKGNSTFGIILKLVVMIGLVIFYPYFFASRRKKKYMDVQFFTPTKYFKIRRIKCNKKGMFKLAIIEIILFLLIIISSWEYIRNWAYIDKKDFIFNWYYLLVIFSVPWLINYLIYGIKTRCRHCKCFYMIKYKNREVVSQKKVLLTKTEDVIMEGYDIDKGEYRQFICNQDRLVPGERVLYEEHYVCKWCQTLHYAYYTIEY